MSISESPKPPAETGNGQAIPADEAPSPGAEPQHAGSGWLDRIAGLFGLRQASTLRDDLTDALSAGGSDAAFTPEERAMLNNILSLRELRVEDVMVARAEIDAVDLSTTLGELLSLFESSGHSRMPVYAETLDDPRGMIHIRDVVAFITRMARTGAKRRRTRKKAGEAHVPPAVSPGTLDLTHVDLTRAVGELSIIRPVLFVPPSMLASDLMARMKAARIQMALVIDEYGGTDGLVSLEDIVEMVVGDIEDEHDDDEPMVTQTGDGVYVVDARAELEDVCSMIGNGFTAAEHIEDVDTIGGMIFNILGRVPVRGEVIPAVPGYEFHVLDADPRRIKRVRIVASRHGPARRRSSRTAPATESAADAATGQSAGQP